MKMATLSCNQHNDIIVLKKRAISRSERVEQTAFTAISKFIYMNVQISRRFVF